MDAAEKFSRVTRNLDEVLTEDELRAALASEHELKHYIGLEISGKIHLGTGLVSMGKIKDFMDAGITTTIFLADWHTF
ncbi:MAG: tyrosine--tRNA ligase, partial [bacterium]|nr:tyrosine--tRNA ligase [bacterium]